MKRTGKRSGRVGSEKRKSESKTGSPVVIRRARMEDLPAVVRMSHGVPEIENYPGQRMKVADFVHFVKPYGGMMLVAEAYKQVVGYITVYPSENYFYLPYSVVRKEWRRRGVGSALLGKVEALAKESKVEYILMSAYIYNKRVHSFLKARGYVPSKKLVQYSKLIRASKKR